jgi:glycosyltransferase involved in cell wall biosynthesis
MDTLGEPEVSVVIPCLDEEEAVGAVVDHAWEGIARSGHTGEVVVVDNGSTDRSAEIARAHGARVVTERRRGYGNAYLAGIAAAQGQTVVMGDADATYPLRDLGLFVDRIEEGDDLVLGSRFAGTIHGNAMPWLNRRIGNPILTGMLNLLFGLKVSDGQCGMRAIRRRAIVELDLNAPGMEFASEMVVKAHRCGLKISEIPIDYFPRAGTSKLNPVRDAWRHVRFMLLYSPSHLFFVPALLMIVVGLAGMLAFTGGPLELFGRTWQIHTMLIFAALTLLGTQIGQLGLFAKTYATVQLGESDALLERLYRRFRLEHGLLVGALTTLVGFAVLAVIFVGWARSGFGALGHEYAAVLGFTLAGVGVQTVFGSFFISILGRPTRRPGRRDVAESLALADADRDETPALS